MVDRDAPTGQQHNFIEFSRPSTPARATTTYDRNATASVIDDNDGVVVRFGRPVSEWTRRYNGWVSV